MDWLKTKCQQFCSLPANKLWNYCWTFLLIKSDCVGSSTDQITIGSSVLWKYFLRNPEFVRPVSYSLGCREYLSSIWLMAKRWPDKIEVSSFSGIVIRLFCLNDLNRKLITSAALLAVISLTVVLELRSWYIFSKFILFFATLPNGKIIVLLCQYWAKPYFEVMELHLKFLRHHSWNRFCLFCYWFCSARWSGRWLH